MVLKIFKHKWFLWLGIIFTLIKNLKKNLTKFNLIVFIFSIHFERIKTNIGGINLN